MHNTVSNRTKRHEALTGAFSAKYFLMLLEPRKRSVVWQRLIHNSAKWFWFTK